MNKMKELLGHHPNRREEIIFYEPFGWLNDATFEDVEINDVVMESWLYTQQYAEEIVEYGQAGSGITYLGNVGTGKTLEMSLLFKFACYTGNFRPANFVYMHDVISAFSGQRRDFDHDKKVRAVVLESELLFIDDVGVENNTGYNKSIVESIFVERYNCRFPTCITSNLTQEEFEQRYGRRVVDRLNQTNRTFELIGDSYRTITRKGG